MKKLYYYRSTSVLFYLIYIKQLYGVSSQKAQKSNWKITHRHNLLSHQFCWSKFYLRYRLFFPQKSSNIFRIKIATTHILELFFSQKIIYYFPYKHSCYTYIWNSIPDDLKVIDSYDRFKIYIQYFPYKNSRYTYIWNSIPDDLKVTVSYDCFSI